MNCPKCENVALTEVVRKTVQIDICPRCKGVWLDRGELEKILQDHRNMERDKDWKDVESTKKKEGVKGNPLLDVLGDIFFFM